MTNVVKLTNKTTYNSNNLAGPFFATFSVRITLPHQYLISIAVTTVITKIACRSEGGELYDSKVEINLFVSATERRVLPQTGCRQTTEVETNANAPHFPQSTTEHTFLPHTSKFRSV